MSPLWAATATELGALYAARATTPLAVLAAVLERIAAVNPGLNAIVTLDADGARAAAEASTARWAAGAALGPLDGVPITVKDNLHVGGMRATWGSALYADNIAPEDDLPVARLRALGAVILGKTNTPELALSGYTDNRVFGATGNPWAPELTSGGSSGGAVSAIAAGLGALAIATDSGGSIRRPSGLAGVAGLKPSAGRVPRRHGFPTLTNDLQVIGPIARSVADLKLAFAAIAAPVAAMVVPTRLRIGVVSGYPGAPMDPAVAAAFSQACAVLRGLGHLLEDIPCPWNSDEAAEIFAALAAGGAARALSPFADWQEACMPNVAATVKAGLARSAVQHVQAIDALTAFRWRVADALAGFDIIATPASPSLAWSKREPFPAEINGQATTGKTASVFSTAINCAGLAALVLPMPVAPGGLPAGLQLVAARMPEEALLDLGEAFELASPWPRLAPG